MLWKLSINAEYLIIPRNDAQCRDKYLTPDLKILDMTGGRRNGQKEVDAG